MARRKTVQENTNAQIDTISDVVPEHQVIVVPMNIDMDEQFGNLGETKIENEKPELEFSVEMAQPKKFDLNIKQFSVLLNDEIVEVVDDGSERLDFYLNENKTIFKSWHNELCQEVHNPNELIFFHEGFQQRTYMSFDAFYSQNGLAPKQISIRSWMDFYKYKHPNFSEEEIVIGAKGNLPYSFLLISDDNNN